MQFPPRIGNPLFYLLLAVVASGALALGLLVMKGRAYALPIAEGRGLIRALGVWLQDPQWLGGLALQAIGYGLYVVAQAVTPVSIVSVMMQGGVGLFVLFAVVVLGEHARPAEWTGIASTIGGMLIMGLSLGAGAEQAPANNMAMAVLSALLLAAGLVPYLAPALYHSGIAAAIFSGVMFGLASLYTKGMTDYYFLAHTPGALSRILANPYVYAMILTNIAGLVALQNSFAAVRGIIAMPLSTALSNIIPIAGASVAFGEHLPRAPWAAAMRMIAFGLTIAGGALLTNPGEHRATPYATGQVPND